MKSYIMGASVLALAAASATPAFAQEAAAQSSAAKTEDGQTGLKDIVVTAQRRSESVQKAALSIVAISGDDLRARGVNNIDALARQTAGIEIQPSGGPYTTFTVRSVSNLSGNAFSDPSIAVNVNGVYLATPTTFRGLFFDLDRVELLKGPQGTLYGRNATGGAINILPAKPTFTLGGYVGADLGNYGHFDINAAVNLPFSDTVAFRMAGQHAKHSGYMSLGTNDEDVNALRASLLFNPSEDVSILLSADWAHEGGKGPGATLRKSCAALGRTGTSCFVADPYTDVGDLPSYYTAAGIAVQSRNPYLDSDYYGVGLNVDWRTGIGTVSLVGGYRKSDVRYSSTATSWQILENQHPKQKSLELRLASPSGQRFGYVIGGYYLDTEMHARANGESATGHNYSDQMTNLSGWTGALFSQLSFAATSSLRLVGGLRYTYEKKNSNSNRYRILANGPDPVIPDGPTGAVVNSVIGSRDWNRVTWKAGVEFDAAPRSLIYANVSTGFKAGGFYYGPPGFTSYEPEKVVSYVLGSKNRFANNRVQINLEAFYLNYTNQQVSFVKLISGSSTLVTENAAKSHAYGLDLDTEFLATPTTRIGFQAQYLRSKYDNFTYLTLAAPPAARTSCVVSAGSPPNSAVNCSDQTTLRSPTWTLVGNIEQGLPLANGGRLVATGNVRYESDYQTDVSYLPEGIANGKARVNLTAGYEAPQNAFSIKAYVDNLTNVVQVTATTMSTSYAVNQAFGARLLPPRTFGVRAQAKF
ncbi:TonB-dependent receptor [Sphingomonas sp. AR_OL41]|uniref:TonB-dependent receptor n=1 Tax=Sphingomonas sp. AR_OL41 TaxID=3042729 RepID=UPI0024813AC4|nr:TonB-dependent receptor [Sphingomonas sp. AR_OL41]MDH7971909.1 TonB-dependent receptor [Sphingomonas sp. AR_OL41]